MAHVPELPGPDLLRDWQRTMQSVLAHERELQRDLIGRAFEPLDAAFGLLEQSGTALRRPSSTPRSHWSRPPGS